MTEDRDVTVNPQGMEVNTELGDPQVEDDLQDLWPDEDEFDDDEDDEDEDID